MRVQHNILAMNAYRNYTTNTSSMQKNLEKLSSGYKINRAGDDAAGLAISEKMRAQITGLEVAQKNAKDGISLVQTAEGALTEVHDMLNRMVELATQSANGTYANDTDREQLQKEVDQLRSEINRIADSANFNGIKLLDGSMGGKPSSIKIEGIDVDKVNAEAGVVEQQNTLQDTEKIFADDVIRYTVSLDTGKSVTVTAKLVVDEDKNAWLEDISTGKKLVDIIEDKSYDASTGVAIKAGDQDTAFLKMLKKTDLAEDFKIESDGNGKFTFTNLTAGKTGVPHINALDTSYTVEFKEAEISAANSLGYKYTTQAVDEGYTIMADDLTLYDGKNKDEAIFTINGKKFVVMSGTLDASSTGFLNAAAALGSDVTILVSDGTNSGLEKADANFTQNIKLIAEVTGLSVIDEASAGIRVSLGDGAAASGLRLQIGDTADSYNQLDVSINDCHTKALGLDGISIADQESAATAVDAIRAAVNYVSDVRGTLGATQNRLDHTINNLSVMTENIQDAESTIRDTDVAEEMMAYTKNNILIQAAQAMLAQANQIPQGVLQLLQ